jgi:putative ABC transport system ATP-binding protein
VGESAIEAPGIAIEPGSEAPESAAVYCKGVTKTFRENGQAVAALRGVDFVCRPGELTLLAGPSGCGKTTLISVIAGILDSDGGDVRVFGTRVDQLSMKEKTSFRSANVGFIFQQFNLLPTLTAAENISVPLLIQGVRRRDAMVRAREVLEQVGLADRADALPRQLSGGQQQRVAIGRALIARPRLIVCDEPTSSLDGATGAKVLELLRRVGLVDNRCVLVVSHDSRIYKYGDRIADMSDGRIVETRKTPVEGASHA